MLPLPSPPCVIEENRRFFHGDLQGPVLLDDAAAARRNPIHCCTSFATNGAQRNQWITAGRRRDTLGWYEVIRGSVSKNDPTSSSASQGYCVSLDPKES